MDKRNHRNTAIFTVGSINMGANPLLQRRITARSISSHVGTATEASSPRVDISCTDCMSF